MAIEIIPKKEQETPSSAKQTMFRVGIVLMIVAVLSSLTFVFLQWNFSRRISAIDSLIQERKTQEVKELEAKVGNYSRKAQSFSSIMQRRKSSGIFFSVIERNMHPNVFLTNLQVNAVENRVSASGVARNITAFDQQLRIMRSDSLITVLDVPTFTRDENGAIVFPLSITFHANAFNN